MKIGIDIRNIGKQRTGDEVVFFNLVKNLAQIDNVNEYLLFTDLQDREILNQVGVDLGIFGKSNFRIVSLNPGAKLGKFVWNFWTLPQYLKKNPVDIYHTQYITPWFVSKKIKIITTIHDVSFKVFPEFIKFFDLFFLRLLIPLSLRRADKIVAVSEFTRAEIIKYYQVAPEKVGVVLNAVADEFGQKEITELDLAIVRKKYSLPEKFILYVGTLQPRKNLPTLVAAYAQAQANLAGAKLVLAGNRQAHNFDAQIDAVIQAKSLEQDVLFPGFISEKDKKALFQAASVFCFPSFYEGFGVPILEALLAGVPTIVSDIQPHREIAGSESCFFQASDATDLAEKLPKVLLDKKLRTELVEQGQNQAKIFTWRKSAEKLLAIYQSSGNKA